jgi:hypothetical protein
VPCPKIQAEMCSRVSGVPDASMAAGLWGGNQGQKRSDTWEMFSRISNENKYIKKHLRM